MTDVTDEREERRDEEGRRKGYFHHERLFGVVEREVLDELLM